MEPDLSGLKGIRYNVGRQAVLPVSGRAWTHAIGPTANWNLGAGGERTIATSCR